MAQTSLNSTGVASSGSLVLQSNGTTAGLTLDTSQKVGIGTTSPAAKLHVDSTSDGLMSVFNSTNANGGYILGRSSATAVWDLGTAKQTLNVGGATDFGINVRSGFMAFGTSNTERMRLDSSGNLGLGVTPSAWGSSKALQILSTVIYNNTANDSFFGSNYYFDGSGNKYINTAEAAAYGQVDGSHRWFSAASGTAGSALTFTQAMTLDASGNLGIGTTSVAAAGTTIHVNGSSTDATIRLSNSTTGATVNDGFRIQSNNADVYFVNHEAGFLAFQTSATERARVTSGGNLLVGRTTVGLDNGAGLTVLSTGSVQVECTGSSFFNRVGSDGAVLSFRRQNADVGSITVNGSGTLYNVTSDQRLKENIVDASPASALIDAIQVRQYNWKSNGSFQRYGFVAQELVTVAPEAVHQPADPEEMMAVDYSKLVPMLVKEIQSLRQRVAQLESN